MVSSKVSVVVPVYNNQATLEELCSRLVVSLKAITNDFEVIFIDDGSQDGSCRLLRDMTRSHPCVKVLVLSRNFGQHPAICAGFEHVTGEVVILMDADLQDRPEDIPILIGKLAETGSDIVYSTRRAEDRLIASRLTSVIYHFVFSRIIGAAVPLNIGTFRAFTKKFLVAVLQFKEVNVLYGPLMFFMGFKSGFVELPYSERTGGKSGYTFSKRLRLAVDSMVSYTDIPHRVSIYIGSCLIAGSLFYSIAILVQYVFFGAMLPAGSTLLFLVLFLTLGSIMMFLGIIGSYVFRVYQEVLKRPRYLIQEKINLS